jgi:C4-dicarboxylate-specific signal transduction histidine kinase
VNFAHLPPGDYRFEVSAANQDGHWGPSAATPLFIVVPFYWETAWFRAAIVLVVMGCGAGGVFAIARGKIRRAVAREQVAKAEAKARHHLNELSHLSRVALVGEMATSLAHELNQPLAAIVTNAGAAQRFLAAGRFDPSELGEILEDITADGRRAGDVIRGIKSMVRRVESERRPLDLNQVITAVMRLVRADALAHGCALDSNLDENVPTILGDSVQLQQVLLNLVINAFDAMGKTPTVPCRLEITSQRINGHTVQVSVRDFGSGLPPEAPNRVFERFFSTKPDGMGMGLAIARSIIEEHSGVIGAENVPGGGARFWFQLPVHSSPS